MKPIKGNKKETDYFEHHQLFNIYTHKFPNVNHINDSISCLTVRLWKLNEVTHVNNIEMSAT